MKYNIKVVRPASMVTTEPWRTQEELIENILKTKSVTIDAFMHSKTTINTGIRCGTSSFRVGYIPNGCEHIKFHAATRQNIWTGQTYASNYFKVTKKQKQAEYMEYVLRILDSLNLPESDEELEVRLELGAEVRYVLDIPTEMIVE